MASCSRSTEQKSLTEGTPSSSLQLNTAVYSTLCKPSKTITFLWSNITHSLVRQLRRWQKLALSFNCHHLCFQASLECRSIWPWYGASGFSRRKIHKPSTFGLLSGLCGYHIKLNSLINILRGQTIKHYFRIDLSWLSRKNTMLRAQTQPAVLYPYISTR